MLPLRVIFFPRIRLATAVGPWATRVGSLEQAILVTYPRTVPVPTGERGSQTRVAERFLDDKAFDDRTRSLASRTNRRWLVRAAVLGLAGAGSARILPTEAARRGYSGMVSICNPTGNGGYTQMSVAAALAPGYLAAGAVMNSGCCADGDCSGDSCSTGVCDPLTGSCQTTPVANGTSCTPDGPANLCREPATCQGGICTPGIDRLCTDVYGACTRLIGCNPSTGQCDYGPAADGTRCNRGSGCAQGTCASGVCMDPPAKSCGGDACQICGYDACNDSCTCYFIYCAGSNECRHNYCNPSSGCVSENINEGGACSGIAGGHCASGECVA